MRTANLAAQTVRQSESGLVWEEKVTGAAGNIEVVPYATFRVRAAAAVTVTIDGVLAMSMASGEIMVFNAGGGDPTDNKQTVTIVTSGNSFIQVARDVDRKAP